MTLDQSTGALRPATSATLSIAAVIEAHGARAVLAAAIAALLRGKTRKTRPPDRFTADYMGQHLMNDHLRRDVGLPQMPEERRIIRL